MFYTATDSVTDMANTEHVGNMQQDAMLPSYVLYGAPSRSFWQWRVGGSALTRRYFKLCFVFFWWKSMQHLSEKTQFPGFLFPLVVQKQQLGVVGK